MMCKISAKMICILCVMFFLFAATAEANLILSLNPSSQTVNVGDTFNITLSSSGTGTEIGSYNFHVRYDESFFALEDVHNLLPNSGQLFGPWWSVTFNPATNSHFVEVNHEFFWSSDANASPYGDMLRFDFKCLQAETNFKIGIGMDLFYYYKFNYSGSFSLVQISDDDVSHPSDVIVNQVQARVPVPAAIWFFGSGLTGLISIRRRFKK